MNGSRLPVTTTILPRNSSENLSGHLPGEFAQHRCSYANCNNGRYTHRKKLFSFPSDRKGERLEKWIENSGNEKLRKFALTTLRHRGVCEDHFDDSSFTSSEKTGLKRTAVPIKYRSPGKIMTVENQIEEEKKSNDENSPIERLHFEKLLDSNLSHESNSKENSEQNIIETTQSIKSLSFEKKSRSDSDQKVYLALQENYRFFEDIDDSILMPSDLTESMNKSLHSDSNKTPTSSIKLFKDQGTNTSTQDANNKSLREHFNESSEISTAETTIPASNTNTSPLLITVSKSYNDHIEGKVKSLRREIALLRKENKVLRRKLMKPPTDQIPMKRRSSKNPKKQHRLLKKEVEDILDQMDLTPVARTIISLQMHAQNLPYTEEQLDLSRKLYDVSPAAIKILRRVGAHFPGINTIRRCHKKIHSAEDSEIYVDYICLEQIDE